jgi:hypothetical protein
MVSPLFPRRQSEPQQGRGGEGQGEGEEPGPGRPEARGGARTSHVRAR